MTRRNLLLLLILTLALPGISRAQAMPNFSGNWKLAQIEPPVDPRNGRPPSAGGGLGGVEMRTMPTGRASAKFLLRRLR